MQNKTKNKLLYLKCDSWTSTHSICGFYALYFFAGLDFHCHPSPVLAIVEENCVEFFCCASEETARDSFTCNNTSIWWPATGGSLTCTSRRAN